MEIEGLIVPKFQLMAVVHGLGGCSIAFLSRHRKKLQSFTFSNYFYSFILYVRGNCKSNLLRGGLWMKSMGLD